MSLINEKKDFKIIADLIPAKSSVIDVGCNDGSLLEFLKEEKDINGRGMEIDQQKVQLCLSKGISVIEILKVSGQIRNEITDARIKTHVLVTIGS